MNVEMDLDETLHDFVSIMVRTGQRRSKRWFQTGSSAELGWTQIGLLEADGSDQDYDFMCCDKSLVGRPASSSISKPLSTDRYVDVSTDDVPVGYAKLESFESQVAGSQQSKPFQKGYSKLRRLVIGERHGPAFNSNIFYLHTFCVEFWKYKLPKDVILRNEIMVTPNLTMDVVHAIHCPYWPVEADEWITRPRKFGFPSPELIDEIACYGFHLVCVQENEDEPAQSVWRYSFSHAELVLIQSWSERQRAVYSALKTLYKKMAQKSKFIGLCSYYFKTLMLWACEENPAEFWQGNSLESVVVHMLLMAVDRLKGNIFCPNYFIRNSNILNRPKRDNEIALLYRWSVNVWRMLTFKAYDLPRGGISTCVSNWSVDNLDSFRLYLCATGDIGQIEEVAKQSLAADLKYSKALHVILAPLWLCSFLLLQREYHTEVENTVSPALRDALSIELFDLHLGLTCQRRGVMCNRQCDSSVVETKEYFRMAKKHLHEAVEWHSKITEDVVMISYDGIECNGLGFYFMKTKADSSAKQLLRNATAELESAEHAAFQDANQKRGRSVGLFRLRHHMPEMSDIVNHSRIVYIMTNGALTADCNHGDEQDHDDDIGWLYKESLGWSPTVNVSWYVAMTHLANFYYAVEQDYKRATELCIELIEMSNKSVMNRISAERTFPIILSASSASHFDETIKQQLHDELVDVSTTELAVCPIYFALYLLVRCSQNDESIRKYRRLFYDHHNHCISDDAITQAGSKILESVIRSMAVSSDTNADFVTSSSNSNADAVVDTQVQQATNAGQNKSLPRLGYVCFDCVVTVCYLILGFTIAYFISVLASSSDDAFIRVSTVCFVCVSCVWGVVAGATRTIAKPVFAALPGTLTSQLIVLLIGMGARTVCQLVLFCTLAGEAGIMTSMIHKAPHFEGAVQGSVYVSVMMLNAALLSYCCALPKVIQELLLYSGAVMLCFSLLITGIIRSYHLLEVWSSYVSNDSQASVASTPIDMAARNAAAAVTLSSLDATTVAVSAAAIVFTAADTIISIVVNFVGESDNSLLHYNTTLMHTCMTSTLDLLNSSSCAVTYSNMSVISTGQCAGVTAELSSPLIVKILTLLLRTAPLFCMWNVRMTKFARQAAIAATRDALVSFLSVMIGMYASYDLETIHLSAHDMSMFWCLALLGLCTVRLSLYFPTDASSYPTNVVELSSWLCFGISKSLQCWNLRLVTLVPIYDAMNGHIGQLLVPIAYYVFERQRKRHSTSVICNTCDSRTANDVVSATLMVTAIID